MNVQKRPYWPQYLDDTLHYHYGKIPLHAYIDRHAKENPEGVAIHYYGKSFTWKQLNRYVNQFAQFLAEQNVKKGDRIALYMQNCPQYIIGYYAIQRIGATVVPLNPMYKETELLHAFQEGEITGIFCSEEGYPHIEEIREQLPELHVVVITNYSDFLLEQSTIPFPEELLVEKRTYTKTFDFLNILQQTEELPQFVEVNMEEDIALLVFTSGTSGRPKGAMLTYMNSLFTTAANAQSNHIKRGARSLNIAPYSHIAGMLMGVNTSVYLGLETVVLTKFDPAVAAGAIEKYRIEVWYSVAIMNVAILKLKDLEKRNLTSLRVNMATSFGIAVTAQLAQQWSEVTDGCLMFEAAYGLSESHTGDTFMPRDRIKYGSCGIAIYETEIKIVDGEGNEKGIDEHGEIILKSKGNFKGYYNRPAETKEVLRDGWLHTGDIGMIDEDGYLYYLGRTKEMIKSSGYSVFPDDVEALLNEHPAISQTVAVGIPDEKRGESVKAFVKLKEEYVGKIEEREIIEWAKEHMAAYKYPREVEFIDEFPSTSTGKILRRLLKQ
ncbi:class I adenylate-forming enzyme family protein [Savagea faecisuis]|uniref:AMP-binding protein n=1 Tax=Savagea faecisuis TaxID=1274803 RepID=A0ABW3H4E5_9BACL